MDSGQISFYRELSLSHSPLHWVERMAKCPMHVSVCVLHHMLCAHHAIRSHRPRKRWKQIHTHVNAALALYDYVIFPRMVHDLGESRTVASWPLIRRVLHETNLHGSGPTTPLKLTKFQPNCKGNAYSRGICE